jgi:methylglutaconyl-CoA hydratase
MDKVITDIDDLGVARVRLNNPDKHNAFDDQMIGQLTEAFAAVLAMHRCE